METMVDRNSKYFGGLKPVFDGRSNMYTRDPLPIGGDRLDLEVTLPGEGKDRVFRVGIKWVSQVSLKVPSLVWFFTTCKVFTYIRA